MPDLSTTYRLIPVIALALSLVISCSPRESLKTSASITRTKRAVVRYKSPSWLEKRKAIQQLTRELKHDDISRIEGTAEKLLLQASMDNHPAVQIEASIGLGYLRSSTSLSMLLALAVPPAHDNVRWYAINSLRRRNSPLALKVFLQGLKSDDWVIREASIMGLLALEDKNEQRKHVGSIIKSLQDPSVTVRISTLENLRLRDRRIYRAVLKNLHRKKPQALIEASLKALHGYMLDGNTKEYVIDMLSHPSTRIRILALRALKEDRRIRLESSEFD